MVTKFMVHQGYETVENKLYQDNQSAIKMEKNGRNLCAGNSRHVKRNFFVKDRVKKREVKIESYPTELMLVDMLTKPLQGSIFKKCRHVIMEYITSSSLTMKEFWIKERVENSYLKIFYFYARTKYP